MRSSELDLGRIMKNLEDVLERFRIVVGAGRKEEPLDSPAEPPDGPPSPDSKLPQETSGPSAS